MKALRTTLILLAVIGFDVWADLDWGGGGAIYFDQDGQPLTVTTGKAVLLATVAGELVDFDRLVNIDPADLTTPGAVLTDADNRRSTVVATTTEFIDGRLLISAVDNVSRATMESFGVASGENLFLMVWSSTAPVDGSRYVIHQLFIDGSASLPATTFGNPLPGPATQIYGDETIASYQTNAVFDVQQPDFDMNGDGVADAATDGIVVLRYLFGFRGDDLIANIGGCESCSAVDIQSRLMNLAVAGALDADDDLRQDALTDGLLIIRGFIDYTGEQLIQSVLSDGCRRCDATDIRTHINGFIPD